MSVRRPTPHDLKARRDAGTCLAMIGLLALAAGLFALVVVVMPDLLLAAGVLAGLVLFMGLHYVTWGWYLSRPRPGDEKYFQPESESEPYASVDPALDSGDD